MRAVIFGFGKYGKALKRGLEKYYGVEIVAVCDNDKHKQETVSVVAPQQLLDISFDKIFICLRRVNEFKQVEQQLLEMGIPEEKIVIMEMSKEYQDAYIELDPFRKNWIKNFCRKAFYSGHNLPESCNLNVSAAEHLYVLLDHF